LQLLNITPSRSCCHAQVNLGRSLFAKTPPQTLYSWHRSLDSMRHHVCQDSNMQCKDLHRKYMLHFSETMSAILRRRLHRAFVEIARAFIRKSKPRRGGTSRPLFRLNLYYSDGAGQLGILSEWWSDTARCSQGVIGNFEDMLIGSSFLNHGKKLNTSLFTTA